MAVSVQTIQMSNTYNPYDLPEIIAEVEAATQEDNKKVEAETATTVDELKNSAKTVSDSQIDKRIMEGMDFKNKISEKIAEAITLNEEKLLSIAMELKRNLEDIAGRITEEDVKNIIKEHYNPEKISIDIFSRVMDKNKVAVKLGNLESLTDDIEAEIEAYKEMFEDDEQLKTVVHTLKEYELRVNKTNIDKVHQALKKANDVKDISDSTVVYMLKNKKALTIEEAYKAKYASKVSNKQIEAVSELRPQIIKVLNECEIPATDENIRLAETLISEDMPLDKETLKTILDIKDALSKRTDTETIIDAVKNIQISRKTVQIPIFREEEQDQEVLQKVEVPKHSLEAVARQVIEGVETNKAAATRRAAGKRDKTDTSKQSYKESDKVETQRRPKVEQHKSEVSNPAHERNFVSKTSKDSSEEYRRLESSRQTSEDIKKPETTKQTQQVKANSEVKVNGDEEVSVNSSDSIKNPESIAKEIVNKLPFIRLRHIATLYDKGKVINLENLVQEVRDTESSMSSNEIEEGIQINNSKVPEVKELENVINRDISPGKPRGVEQELKIIKATLQVQEIRLKMTFEAATRLFDKGIRIDTEPVSKVVEELRNLERETYAKHLYYQDVPQTKLEEVETIMDGVKVLNYIAPSTIRKVVEGETPFTIVSMADETVKMIANEYVVQSYDVMSTKPRRDLGDSLEKTFNQIDSILEDLNLEKTEANVRAVKILARNEMPITEEMIEAIKMVDQKVLTIIEKLHPSVVVNMIKEELSPLQMHVDEVLEYIKGFEDKNGLNQMQSVAQMILDMDKQNTLTQEERDSMIGIYRMFSTVAKSKGAAVGFLIKNELPCTINGLFEAAKFLQKSRGQSGTLKADIDDNFGVLDKVNQEGSIKEQIKAALRNEGITPTKENIQLYSILQNLDVDSNAQAMNQGQRMQWVLDKFLESMDFQKLIHLKQEGLLDGDIPLEKCIDVLKTEYKAEIAQIDGENAKTYTTLVKALSDIDMESLKTVAKAGIEPTLENLSVVSKMSENPFWYVDIMENLMNMAKDISQRHPLAESLNRIVEAYNEEGPYNETLDKISEVIEKSIEEAGHSSKSEFTRSLQQMEQIVNYQKSIYRVEDYYQIPMWINGKMTQINLYYLQDNQGKNQHEEDKMKVFLYFKTENMGKVQAYLNIKGNQADFGIYASDSEDMALIKTFEGKFRKVLNDSIYHLKDINYGYFEAKSPIGEAISSRKSPKAQKAIRNKDTQLDIEV